MTAEVFTITRDVSVYDALRMMKSKHIRRLPIMDGETLVGIVTWTDLMRASPSSARRLSADATARLTKAMSVGNVMTPDPITVAPDTAIEQTAVLMREHKIGALPVLKRRTLVGIITESDVFDAFIKIMGLRSGGTRLTVRQKEGDALADIVNTVRDCEAGILSVATYGMHGAQWTVVRVDAPYPLHVVQTLVERGIDVTHLAPLPNSRRDRGAAKRHGSPARVSKSAKG